MGGMPGIGLNQAIGDGQMSGTVRCLEGGMAPPSRPVEPQLGQMLGFGFGWSIRLPKPAGTNETT
jgi:hypothetical protein